MGNRQLFHEQERNNNRKRYGNRAVHEGTRNFKPHIYEGFKNESAKPHFWMSPQKWINEANATGMISKSGRYGGGTFVHFFEQGDCRTRKLFFVLKKKQQ